MKLLTLIITTSVVVVIAFEYKLCESCIIRTAAIKGLGVLLVSRLYFHQHAACIFSHALKQLVLFMLPPFPSYLYIVSLCYILLLCSDLDLNISPVSQPFLSSDLLQLYDCFRSLNILTLCTNCKRQHLLLILHTQFLVNVYNGFKFRPSLLESVDIPVSPRFRRIFFVHCCFLM